MTEVRSPHRTLLADTVGSEDQKPTSLQGLANKAKTDKQHRFRDLYGGLNADLLLDCWRDLNKQAASGVDGLTAAAYQAHWQANITALVYRLQTPRDRAKLVRRCYIPKANGAERPLGIPALEDNLGPLACAKLLMAIDEQDFWMAATAIAPDGGRWMRSGTSPSTSNTGCMATWSRPTCKASSTSWTTRDSWPCCASASMTAPFSA